MYYNFIYSNVHVVYLNIALLAVQIKDILNVEVLVLLSYAMLRCSSNLFKENPSQGQIQKFLRGGPNPY